MNWLIFLVVGAVAGFLAGRIMGGKNGLIRNLIIGVIGSYIGSYIASLIGYSYDKISIEGTLIAALGACILLAIGRVIFGK